jgi:hypothetical protein
MEQQWIHERDLKGCVLQNRVQDCHWSCVESEVADDSTRNVGFDAATGRGENVEFIAEIGDLSGESQENGKKNNQEEFFPVTKTHKSRHECFLSTRRINATNISSFVKCKSRLPLLTIGF